MLRGEERAASLREFWSTHAVTGDMPAGCSVRGYAALGTRVHEEVERVLLDKPPTVLVDAPALPKCFSVKDPWITMIELELKPYELRTRVCHYRGLLVLCASASRSRTKDASKWPQHAGPLGVARCVVEMVDCYPAKRKHAKGAGCMPSEGEYVWEFRHVRKLSTYVPIKGSLSFFQPTDELVAQLRKDGII